MLYVVINIFNMCIMFAIKGLILQYFNATEELAKVFRKMHTREKAD